MTKKEERTKGQTTIYKTKDRVTQTPLQHDWKTKERKNKGTNNDIQRTNQSYTSKSSPFR
jgi:hypothetical protein